VSRTWSQIVMKTATANAEQACDIGGDTYM
jgi:hypothetical protein